MATRTPPPRPLGALVAAAVVVVALLAPPSAAAQVDGDGRVGGVIAGTHPELAGVEVEGPGFEREADRYRRLRAELAEAIELRDRAAGRIASLELRRQQLGERLAQVRARVAKLEPALAEVGQRLEVVAVDAFVSSGAAADPVANDGDPDAAMRSLREERLTLEVGEVLFASRRHLRGTLEEVRAEERWTAASLASTEEELARTERERDQAAQRADELWPEVAAQGEAVLAARATATVAGRPELSLVALDAYTRAERALAAVNPACGLRWPLLAGIGRVESRHGTYRGAGVAADGAVTPEIIGIPLDGTRGTALIGDTDGGALDRDATFDRAVGPMQFIPSTWARWAADQTGDGRADPHNLYDAALTSGVYLCAVSGGLDTDAGARRAAFGYNRSEAYVDRVLELASEYAAAVQLGPPRAGDQLVELGLVDPAG